MKTKSLKCLKENRFVFDEKLKENSLCDSINQKKKLNKNKMKNKLENLLIFLYLETNVC